jgi:hypothetical protein
LSSLLEAAQRLRLQLDRPVYPPRPWDHWCCPGFASLTRDLLALEELPDAVHDRSSEDELEQHPGDAHDDRKHHDRQILQEHAN